MLAALSSYDNEYASFWIEQQLLFFEYKKGIVIDLPIAQKILSDRLLFQNEKAYPILCDVRGLQGVDKSARDYLAKSGSLMATAVALLTDAPKSNIISQFYLTVSQPSVPTQVFYHRSDAITFLQSYI